MVCEGQMDCPWEGTMNDKLSTEQVIEELALEAMDDHLLDFMAETLKTMMRAEQPNLAQIWSAIKLERGSRDAA